MTKKRVRTPAPLSSAQKRAAFNDMADAIGKYLTTIGWTALVVGNPRIQHEHDAREFNFEFVVKFTGGQKKGPT